QEVKEYAIFLLDVDGTVLTWNAGAERLKGYTADEAIGQNISIFYPPEDIALNKPSLELEEAAKKGRVEDEGWRVRKDGTRFWGNVVITAIYQADGKLRGFGKVTRDMTEQRANENALREAQAALELRVQERTGELQRMNTE